MGQYQGAYSHAIGEQPALKGAVAGIEGTAGIVYPGIVYPGIVYPGIAGIAYPGIVCGCA